MLESRSLADDERLDGLEAQLKEAKYIAEDAERKFDEVIGLPLLSVAGIEHDCNCSLLPPTGWIVLTISQWNCVHNQHLNNTCTCVSCAANYCFVSANAFVLPFCCAVNLHCI